MTIMGMAASQARFLGLTARKSNVEYQGQQVNQQRTALANESSNLYSQMMNLTVPTPPAESEFYKTTQVLEGSSDSYAASDYEIINAVKTYNKENEYTITLSTKVENQQSLFAKYKLDSVQEKTEEFNKKDDDGNTVTENKKYYQIGLLDNSGLKGAAVKISYYEDEADRNPYEVKDGQKVLSIKNYQLYNADSSIEGYKECCDKEGTYLFYQDGTGNNHFITQDDLNEMLKPKEERTKETFEVGYMHTYYTNVSTKAVGIMEKSSTGRFSSIAINSDGNEQTPSNLVGQTFNITTTRVKDEEKYEEAFNDYEYEKYLYEKSISDINAQTEVIQKEDQQLELRLDQLDTEQNAISTEMEAVTKVIEDNVEKTFKIFA